jgi:hypothetical protein
MKRMTGAVYSLLECSVRTAKCDNTVEVRAVRNVNLASDQHLTRLEEEVATFI